VESYLVVGVFRESRLLESGIIETHVIDLHGIIAHGPVRLGSFDILFELAVRLAVQQPALLYFDCIIQSVYRVICLDLLVKSLDGYTLTMSILEESDRTSSGISLKLYNVTMTHAMNMNVTSVNTALTCPPSMTPIHGGEIGGGRNRIPVYRFDST